MASVSQNPYTTYKDCSQGICSIYCPQWCYFIFPPPPPFTIGDDGSDTTDFSPLIIAVIGILASAFILISYYTIISKYCRRRGGGSSGQNSMELNGQNREQTPYASSGTGLDETLIKSITVCKYKKNDGFIEGTDCSVCLSEFEEDESLRLLPKCSHAFHLPCIDPWLKAHASCPLCRANIASSNISPVQESAPTVQETNVSAAQEYQHRIDDAVLVIQDLDRSFREEEVVVVSLAAGEDGDHVPQKDIEAQDRPIQPIRRSVSLNSPVCETQVSVSISIADILCNSEEEEDDDDEQVRDKGKRKSGILNMVRSSAEMKRSISTGRFMFTRYEKGRGSTIPN